MEYQVIDETIGLYSCGAADLTAEQVQTFLNQKPGQDIENFTIFFDRDSQILVMNHEHGNYELYLAALQDYVEFNKQQRRKMLELVAQEEELKRLLGFYMIIDIALEEKEGIHADIK